MSYLSRNILLACLVMLLFVGLSAYYMIGEDECRNLIRHSIRYFRYLAEDLTGSNSRDDWK